MVTKDHNDLTFVKQETVASCRHSDPWYSPPLLISPNLSFNSLICIYLARIVTIATVFQRVLGSIKSIKTYTLHRKCVESTAYTVEYIRLVYTALESVYHCVVLMMFLLWGVWCCPEVLLLGLLLFTTPHFHYWTLRNVMIMLHNVSKYA